MMMMIIIIINIIIIIHTSTSPTISGSGRLGAVATCTLDQVCDIVTNDVVTFCHGVVDGQTTETIIV